MLLAYNEDGDVVATLDYLVSYDPDTGDALGLVDFEAVEEAGRPLTDVWEASDAVGSGTWPEWIGTAAHDFKVTRSGGKIIRLTHRKSKAKRSRAEVKKAIAAAIRESEGPPNITAIVGSPVQSLMLDADGQPAIREKARRTDLPLVRRTET